jgi:hypothetical protein
MNRKLHNTLSAVVASSALLVLGLLVAVPAAPAPDLDIAAIDGMSSDAGEALEAARLDLPAPGHAHARRQSVRMPFFSFAPRG